MPDAKEITWIYPSPEELLGKIIRIEITGLQHAHMALVTDAETGEGISHVTRVQLDIAVGQGHSTAIVTIGNSESPPLENIEVLIDAEVRDVIIKSPVSRIESPGWSVLAASDEVSDDE